MYATGLFNLSASYPGATTVVGGVGGSDAYLLKVDAAGNPLALAGLLATTVAAGAGGQRLAVAPNGDVVVAGFFGDAVDFDPSAAAFVLTSAGGNSYDAVVAQYTSALGFVRAARFGDGGFEIG